MGAHPYWYFVKYQADIGSALSELREREFKAGRYNPVIRFPGFPTGLHSPSPGAQHSSIEHAIEDAGEDGTRSILDLARVVDRPEDGAVAPVDDQTLIDLYGTSAPTRSMVERDYMSMDFLESVERGQGLYVVLYRDGQPDEILFAGYSYD